MLRIGLDKRAIEEGFKAHFGRGTGRYATEVLRNIPQAAAHSSQLTLHPFGTKELGASALEQLLYRAIPLGRMTLEQQILLPGRLKRSGMDRFHFFAHVDAPARLGIPYSVTVLDLIPLLFAELYKAERPNWRYHFARFLELRAIRGASGIITISEASKRDIVKLLGYPAERIVVTPLAVGAEFKSRQSTVDSLSRDISNARSYFPTLPKDGPVLLYVGGIDPRKNVEFLMRLLGKLRQRPETARVQLAMSGRYDSDRQYPRLHALVAGLGLQDAVSFLGFVPDELLPLLYHAANVTVFPSLYEGFGLPVLESMACGVAVVAGNNSSIPEVAGSASVLLPDGQLDTWVDRLSELLLSPERQVEFGERGAQRAAHFSWKRTAEQTVGALEQFAGLKPSFAIRCEQEVVGYRGAAGG